MPIDTLACLLGRAPGKSPTSVAFLERLTADRPDLRTRMLTFTRAATAEFAEKIGDANREGLGVTPPATVHGFALSVLMASSAHGLPMPLRIPDDWELRVLVEPALAERLRAMRHDVDGQHRAQVGPRDGGWMGVAGP